MGCPIPLPGEFDNLLNTRDDMGLCSGLFDRIAQHCGHEVDLAQCRERDRVVLLVYHGTGVIDNGGFRDLFEGEFEGDPHFTLTAAAFKAIGAPRCAAAAEEALRLFPGGRPPADKRERLRLYQRSTWERRQAVDSKGRSCSEPAPATGAEAALGRGDSLVRTTTSGHRRAIRRAGAGANVS
jgi:hypothetical protein